MYTIHSLQFDRTIIDGWFKGDDTDIGHGWFDNTDDPSRALMIDFFPKEKPFPPDLALQHLDALRQDCLQKAHQEGMCLLEYGVITCPSKLQFMRALEKKLQKPHGMAYKLTMTLLGHARFRVTMWCFGKGTTGLRDSMVLDEFMGTGSFNPDLKDWGGWWIDPHNFGPQPLMQNLCEDEKYDAQFPDHPLTQLRSYLKRLQDSLQLTGSPESADKGSSGNGWLSRLFGKR